MVQIQIDPAYATQVDAHTLVRRAEVTLQHRGVNQGVGLTLVITGDEQIQELNHRYLGEDSSTDVLAFPGEYVDPDTNISYLGDVLISFPRALDQARLAGKPVISELQLLVVHGVLHLLGFDHGDDEQQARMWAVQDEILADLSV